MSREKDKKFVEEIGSDAIFLLQEIVDTPIGKKAFESFGVQYPVEFLAWCYTANYDMISCAGCMPAEMLSSPDVLIAASVESERRSR